MQPLLLTLVYQIAMSGISAVRSFAPVSINGEQQAFRPATRHAVRLICQNGTGIFALGVQHHVLYGQLGWFVMFIAALGYIVVVRHLPGKAYGLPVTASSRRSAPDEEQGT